MNNPNSDVLKLNCSTPMTKALWIQRRELINEQDSYKVFGVLICI